MGALINLSDKKFGRLLVIGKDNDNKKKGAARWICLCDCGAVKSISSYALRSGATRSCGCLNREIITGKSNAHNLYGERFGKLTVMSRAKNKTTLSGQTKAMWLCQCDCGNTTIAASQDLKTGHIKSCGCLPTKKTGSGLIDLVGKRFSKLLVIERVNDYVSPKGAMSPSWLCKCDCGNMVIIQGGNLRNGVTKNCGCENRYSNGEILVGNYLKRNGIEYIREYSFPDLKSKKGKCFRFDFAVLDSHSQIIALIEYQGQQHYLEGLKFGKYQREYSDKMKREYCKNHHIPLYEIKFDDDIEFYCDKIFKELIPHANPVPNLN